MGIGTKTMSFRVDEDTQVIMEEIQSFLADGVKEVTMSEVFRFAMEFTRKNYKNDNLLLDWDEIKMLIKSYLASAYLTKISSVNYNFLDDLLEGVDRVDEENFREEIREVFDLYNHEAELTLGKLLRFKHKLMPKVFLTCLGIAEEEYGGLSHEEIADFILNKLSIPSVREDANRLFHLKI